MSDGSLAAPTTKTYIMKSFWEVLLHIRFSRVSGDEVTLEVLNAFGNHMCTSCFISPDLLRASLTPPHNISTLQWRAESADSVWLASLICDERGREWDLAVRQRASWPGCSAAPSPQPAADAPANTTPATKSTFFLFLVLYFQKNNFQ